MLTTRSFSPFFAPSTPLISKSIFVFGWNDFLCPSTWLQQTAAMHPNQLQHPTHRQLLGEIDMCIVNILRHARTLGEVYVVCDDEMTYLEQTCFAFFPQCAQFFLQSDIVLVPHTSNALCSIYSSSSMRAQLKLTVFGGANLRGHCISVLPNNCVIQKFVCTQTQVPSIPEVAQLLARVQQGLLAMVAQHHASLDIQL